jgi:hypothetical protein
VIFVGIDWSEAHHDVCVLDDQGMVLAKGKVSDDVSGVGRLHAMAAEHAEDPSEVVGIETDRGLLVGSLVQAGYRVYAINPLAASRVPGPPRRLPGQVRPGRCQGPGRSRAHRPPEPPGGGR